MHYLVRTCKILARKALFPARDVMCTETNRPALRSFGICWERLLKVSTASTTGGDQGSIDALVHGSSWLFDWLTNFWEECFCASLLASAAESTQSVVLVHFVSAGSDVFVNHVAQTAVHDHEWLDTVALEPETLLDAEFVAGEIWVVVVAVRRHIHRQLGGPVVSTLPVAPFHTRQFLLSHTCRVKKRENFHSLKTSNVKYNFYRESSLGFRR